MVILSFASFPPTSGKEVGKRFLELTPLPEYISTNGPYIYSTQGGGIHGITIYELADQTKMAEAIVLITDRLVPAFDIPGYTYDVRAVNEAGEALKMIGLE